MFWGLTVSGGVRLGARARAADNVTRVLHMSSPPLPGFGFDVVM